MKRLTIFIAIAALVCGGCAKKVQTHVNESAKLYFEAWMQVNHPDLEPTALGAYVLEDIPGTGAPLASPDEYPYVRVNCTRRNLDGTVVYTNRESVAQQIGDYDETYYYGPASMPRPRNITTT